MANYNCVTRTNYFRVKDENEFKNVMKHIISDEDYVDVWEDTRRGVKYYGFGSYGKIIGYIEDVKDPDEEDYDIAYDEMCDMLQKCVADDDAILIFESGHEKLRYVTGEATIITSKGTKWMSIAEYAIREAQNMIGNKQWATKTCY